MNRSAFIRGLLDDPRDPQLPQSVPQNDFGPRAYGLLNALMPDPYEAAGEAVQQFRAGNPIDAFVTMYGAMPATGALKVRPSVSSISGGVDHFIPEYARQKDPRLYHPISGTKLPRPIGEMHAETTPVEGYSAPKFIRPEDLEGASLIPALGDRAAGGGRLTGFNDVKLSSPVDLQAGQAFMRGPAANGPDKAAWASDRPVISRLAGMAREEADAGFAPYLSYTAMSPQSVDYSHHVTDALLGQLQGAKINQDAIDLFTKHMRENTANKWKAFNDFPGLLSPDLESYLYGGKNGTARTKIAQLMDQKLFKDAGFPNVAETRFAITDPGLLHASDYSSGRAISKLDPTGRVITSPAVPHKTYRTQLGADPNAGYVGGFAHDIPFDVMNKEWIDAKMAQDATKYSNPSMLAYTYRMESPTVRMTPEVVDRLSRYLESVTR